MTAWHRFHLWRWWVRWPAKLVVFIAAVTLILYPAIWLLPRHIARLRDLNSVIDPSQPGLAELELAVRANRRTKLTAGEMLGVVQNVVYERIPYAFDWDTWGVMNYVPTTAEALRAERTDCKGRAVVAASLLRRMGYDAWLVADLQHMWVATPAGETMSPGAGEKTLEGGKPGEGPTEIHWTIGALENLGRSLSFGIGVFPLTREILILAALCAVTMHPRSSPWRRVAGCGLVLLALGLVRDSLGYTPHSTENPLLTWIGLGVLIAGWLLLAIKAGGRRSPPEPPESPAADGAAPG
jgi:hypothetical protein